MEETTICEQNETRSSNVFQEIEPLKLNSHFINISSIIQVM